MPRKLYDILTPEEREFRKTFSKKPKPKRGRPKAFDEILVAFFGGNLSLGPTPNTTWCGQMNQLYGARVLHVLFPDDDLDYEWIRTHTTVLCELGRIDDEDAARSIYKQIRESNWTTRKAIAAIRQWRIGHAPEKSPDKLYGQIVKMLEGYSATTTNRESLEEIHYALRKAIHLVERALANLDETAEETSDPL